MFLLNIGAVGNSRDAKPSRTLRASTAVEPELCLPKLHGSVHWFYTGSDAFLGKPMCEVLLQKGVDLGVGENPGENPGTTGLHWAVVGGQLDTIKLLLERGAPLEANNVYGGTALGQPLLVSHQRRSRD
jgi:ankyrin repeat protein